MKPEYDFSNGRRGAVIPQTGKTRITIYLDDDVLEAFRSRAEAGGRGYQTLINAALRAHLANDPKPLDEGTLRRVLREELEPQLVDSPPAEPTAAADGGSRRR